MPFQTPAGSTLGQKANLVPTMTFTVAIWHEILNTYTHNEMNVLNRTRTIKEFANYSKNIFEPSNYELKMH